MTLVQHIDIDFAAPADVFFARGAASGRGTRFKGFDTAAAAIRYVMEQSPSLGETAVLESEEQRFGLAEITELYNDPRYPLPRQLTDLSNRESSRQGGISVPITQGAMRKPLRQQPAEHPRSSTDGSATVSSAHRFGIGTKLRMTGGGQYGSRNAAFCLVKFLLPHEGGQLLYRVKSDLEAFERVVAEGDLSLA
jgi:hypothetical protein